MHGVAQNQNPLFGFIKGDVPQSVPGSMQHPQGYAASLDLVAPRERPVYPVGLDGLVEPLGAAHLPVPPVDEVRVPAVGGDRRAVASLQPAVAPDVVAVVVGVDDQGQLFRRQPGSS